MTPWSEKKKQQTFFIITLLFFCVFSLVCFKIMQSLGGFSLMKACAIYAFKILKKGDFSSIDLKAFCLGVFSFFYVILFLFLLVVVLLYQPPQPYGEARFAEKTDIKKSNLFLSKDSTGLIVGKFKKKLLSPRNLRHGIVLAPTRSGKTAGFVIPTALSFKGSLIITDPKGELEALLAKPLQKMGKKIYLIDWADAFSKDAWNPLSLNIFPSVMHDFAKAERQAERISAMLVGQEKETASHWETTAKRNIASLILFVVYLAEQSILRLDPANKASVEDYEEYHEPHLNLVYSLVAKENEVSSIKESLQSLLNFATSVNAPKRIISDISSWLKAPENEAGSHLTTFLSKIQLWRSEAVKGATRQTSFTWQDLRQNPSVVFIKFPQQDAQSLGILTALFFETFFGWALDTPQQKNEAPIAILADEFGSLPKINLMTDFLSKGAGMGAVIWLIVQDFAQIKAVYGDKHFDTIKTNCSYLLTYAQNNFNTQKELAQMTGKATYQRKNKSKSPEGKRSYSYSFESVDLISVADWGSIPFGFHILLCQGEMTRPVFCKTPLYFKEKSFKEKLDG